MSTLNELFNEQISNFANALTVSGATAELNPDNWTVSGSGLSSHNLSSTDMSSAQDESDAWFLSNGHKRVSVWYGGGSSHFCIVAL